MKLSKLKYILLFALFNLSCIKEEKEEEDILEDNILDIIQYQWWRLEQANLFITEDACFYIDPKNLYLYIHFLDSGNYWNYNLEYNIEEDIFKVIDTSFSFWFSEEKDNPQVTVKFGLLQKKSYMELCYIGDTYTYDIRPNINNPFFVTYPICK